MKDPLSRRFFLEPTQTLHRRYEALRAVFVEGHPQRAVAQRFGYTYDTLRRMVSDFRAQRRAEQVPPFSAHRGTDDLQGNLVAAPRLVQPKPLSRIGDG